MGGDGGVSPRDRATSWKSLVIAVGATVVAALAVALSRHWPRDAKLYPTIIGVATMALGVLCILQCLRGMVLRRKNATVSASAMQTVPAPVVAASVAQSATAPSGGTVLNSTTTDAPGPSSGAVVEPFAGGTDDGADDDASEMAMLPAPPVRKELTMLLWMAGMFAGVWLFGFGVAGVVFALVYLLFACREKLYITIPIAVGVWVLYYFVFVKTLAITLPSIVFHII